MRDRTGGTRAIFGIAATLIVAAWAMGAERRIEVDVAPRQVARYAKVEMTLRVEAAYQNPYDPDEADMRVELTSPSGRKLTVPAFHYQDFERRPLRRGNSSKWLYPVGAPTWKARFAPTEVGTYKGVAVLADRLGWAQSQPITFECAPSASRGFVRVASGDRRYLAFDDGTPFFAIGQNVAFVYNSYATIEKVRKLGGNGANFARVWACAEDWAMAIEARKSAWGRSWAWDPPIVAMPDRGGFHSSKLCLKLSGEAGVRITLSPSHPVSPRPSGGCRRWHSG